MQNICIGVITGPHFGSKVILAPAWAKYPYLCCSEGNSCRSRGQILHYINFKIPGYGSECGF
uniref:Uncharacterized protein n=1 Tax=Solanum tuberosum TaxID=4113 RepID=M1BPE9_SOLTU